MRDPKRCEEFCKELAKIWSTEVPDWRFSQLIVNVFGACENDPWHWEDDKMMKHFKQYFKKQP